MADSKIEIDISNRNLVFLDIYDLSVIEMMTLNFLVGQREAILRYDVYKHMNKLLGPLKKLSTGSFYNSLIKLEKRGLLTFEQIDNDDPKSLAVQTTKDANKLLGYMFYYFTQHAISINPRPKYDPAEIILNVAEMDPNTISNFMIIDPETETNSVLIESILPSAVSTMQSLNSIIKPNKFDLLTANEMYDYYIKGPNEKFDLIVYPMYSANLVSTSTGYESILKCSLDILSDHAKIVIIFLEDPADSDHYFIQHYLNRLRESGYFQTLDKDFLEFKLSKMGFRISNKVSHEGVSYIAAVKK
ncbi:MAG: hypothetical protein INQ03_03285 [Candidatus Heimdallarchaeota archaeon]|nr:hypothetical protein [Candidatus Heimdallarchaeota archaeon]